MNTQCRQCPLPLQS
jgi:hypothetical protein